MQKESQSVVAATGQSERVEEVTAVCARKIESASEWQEARWEQAGIRRERATEREAEGGRERKTERECERVSERTRERKIEKVREREREKDSPRRSE